MGAFVQVAKQRNLFAQQRYGALQVALVVEVEPESLEILSDLGAVLAKDTPMNVERTSKQRLCRRVFTHETERVGELVRHAGDIGVLVAELSASNVERLSVGVLGSRVFR